jgi:hypothetical protein
MRVQCTKHDRNRDWLIGYALVVNNDTELDRATQLQWEHFIGAGYNETNADSLHAVCSEKLPKWKTCEGSENDGTTDDSLIASSPLLVRQS